jgi:Na+/melibiose symporter-like transporter
MKKMNLKDLLVINVYWIGLSFMWNSLHPIILPAILLYLVPEDLKNSYLGLLTFIGLILAMVIQPISGAASDRWQSRWGRRRPLALIGTSLDFIFLALLAWSGNIAIVIIGYIGLQIVSNIAHGPMQGLIPDMVPEEQMGAASGVKNLMDMGGLIIVSLAAGRLLSPDDRYPTTIMIVVMVVLAVSAATTFIFAREKPTSEQAKNRNRISFKEIFLVDFRGNRNYFRLIASRFMFLIGIYGVQTFAQYFIRDVMQVPNPIQTTGDLMAALALSLVACSLIGGWLSDRIGARKVVAIASVIAAAGSFLLIFAKDLATMTLYASVLGAGIGFYLTSNWAFASKLAPKAEAGKFLGLTNLATAGASAMSKLAGVPIDIANHAMPGRFLGYYGLFFMGGLFALLSLILLSKVED